MPESTLAAIITAPSFPPSRRRRTGAPTVIVAAAGGVPAVFGDELHASGR